MTNISESKVEKLLMIHGRKVSDPQHPVWDFARYVVLMTAVTIILWANASDFDVTEGRSIAALGAVMASWETFQQFIKWRADQAKGQ